jgi:hypothetical protein
MSRQSITNYNDMTQDELILPSLSSAKKGGDSKDDKAANGENKIAKSGNL